MARREIDVFGLAFLDVMFCGFGSVILLIMVISSQGLQQRQERDMTLHSEIDKLETEVIDGRINLVEIKNSLAKVEEEETRTEGLSERVLQQIKQQTVQLADQDKQSLARTEHIRQLQNDLKQLEQSSRRLAAASESTGPEGNKVRAVAGEGQRQYLTGLKVGGKHIVILIDVSASMLDQSIVNIIRRKNLSPAERLKSPKWQRVIATVDWLTAQIPADSQFQIFIFNEASAPLLPQTGNSWLPAAGGKALNQAMERLKRTAPLHGSSLASAFVRLNHMNPRPDNVYLLTDGLPTQGIDPVDRPRVSGVQRLQFFIEAASLIPPGTPINTILFPIEGDPLAASSYWRLAMQTNGSFISASSDWP